jgi:hypothetical protein
VLAALPNVIAQTIGDMVAGAMTGDEGPITFKPPKMLDDLPAYTPTPLDELVEYTPLRIRPASRRAEGDIFGLGDRYSSMSDEPFPTTFFQAVDNLNASNQASLTFYSGGLEGGLSQWTGNTSYSDPYLLSGSRSWLDDLRTIGGLARQGGVPALLVAEAGLITYAGVNHAEGLYERAANGGGIGPDGNVVIVSPFGGAHEIWLLGPPGGSGAIMNPAANDLTTASGERTRVGFGVEIRNRDEEELVARLRAQGATSNQINTQLSLLRLSRGEAGVRGGNLEAAVRRYADLVASNKKWGWDSDFGERFTSIERGAIRRAAIDRGLVPNVPYKLGTSYLDFETAGLIQAVDYLPERLWLSGTTAQEKWLNARLPNGQPVGTTWHHTEIPGRMELVPFGVHNVYQHDGGQSPGHWARRSRR